MGDIAGFTVLHRRSHRIRQIRTRHELFIIVIFLMVSRASQKRLQLIQSAVLHLHQLIEDFCPAFCVNLSHQCIQDFRLFTLFLLLQPVVDSL